MTGAPVAPRRYPLVVFSHGYAGFRDQSTFLTAGLASWGFVVAAPDHFSRDLTEVLGGPIAATAKTTDVQDLKATIAFMKAENGSAASPFSHHVDLSLIGAVGHSAGGAAVEALAATDSPGDDVRRPGRRDGRCAFGATKSGPDSTVPHQPGLLMSGTADHVVSDTSMISAYGKLHAPKRLILVKGAGHLVFADLCEVGSIQGGLLSIAAGSSPGSRLARASGLRRLQRSGSRSAPGMAADPSGGHGAVAAWVRIRRVGSRPDRARRGVPEGGGGGPRVAHRLTHHQDERIRPLDATGKVS